MTADEVMAVQDESYRLFVDAHTPEYRALFRGILARDGRPLLIHCAGGKDRTGLGAALILLALGVPEETVTADYMTSAESKSLVRYIEGLAAKHPAGQTMYDEAMHLFGVRRERLHCAFAAARKRNGSLDAYLADALGLGRHQRDTMKSWYLE
jgi:protein-tyrosine phosphatase